MDTLKFMGGLWVAWVFFGTMGSWAGGIYQEAQFIRAYPDKADREYRKTGIKPPGYQEPKATVAP